MCVIRLCHISSHRKSVLNIGRKEGKGRGEEEGTAGMEGGGERGRNKQSND